MKVGNRREPGVAALVLALVVLAADAAPAVAGAWRLGLQGGANFAAITGDTPSGVGLQRRSGPALGLVAERRLADDVWLSVQPMVVRGGTKSRIAVSGQTEPVSGPTLGLDYLAVPLLVRILADNGWTYATGGVDVAYLLAAELDDAGVVTDVRDAFRDLAVGAEIGIGVLIPAGTARVSLEFRYEQGILNLATSAPETDPEILPPRFRATGFRLLAGVLWTIGGD